MPITDVVRSSCAEAAAAASHVRISESGVAAYAEGADVDKIRGYARPARMPLKFDSKAAEISFIAVKNLLEVGSGYRADLHRLCGRGASDTITFGCLAVHLQGHEFTAQFMKSVMADQIADWFSIPMTEDRETQPGIYLSERSALAPLVDTLHRILREAGERLSAAGCRDFAQFIVQTCKENKSSAVGLADRLFEMLPSLQDEYEYKGNRVVLAKRAQLIPAEIHMRFAAEDELLSFADIGKLTVFADNVLPAILRHHGVLELDDALAKRVDAGELIPAGSDQEIELRACAVAACEQIVAKLDGAITAADLDMCLWKGGKEGDLRKFPRHLTRDTVFY